jgi:hypothetical protein
MRSGTCSRCCWRRPSWRCPLVFSCDVSLTKAPCYSCIIKPMHVADCVFATPLPTGYTCCFASGGGPPAQQQRRQRQRFAERLRIGPGRWQRGQLRATKPGNEPARRQPGPGPGLLLCRYGCHVSSCQVSIAFRRRGLPSCASGGPPGGLDSRTVRLDGRGNHGGRGAGAAAGLAAGHAAAPRDVCHGGHPRPRRTAQPLVRHSQGAVSAGSSARAAVAAQPHSQPHARQVRLVVCCLGKCWLSVRLLLRCSATQK